MFLTLYIVYKKHDDDKNSRSNQRKIARIIASDPKILLSIVHDRSYGYLYLQSAAKLFEHLR